MSKKTHETQTKKRRPKMRYTMDELQIIKDVFAENEPLVTALRKVFLYDELTDDDRNTLKQITDTEVVLDIVLKTYYPQLLFSAPVGQMIDMWMSVEVGQMSPSEAWLRLKARKRLTEMLDGGVARLQGTEVEHIEILNFEPDFKGSSDEEIYIETMARNMLIQHTETQLLQLLILGGRKDETIEELKQRLEQNSTE